MVLDSLKKRIRKKADVRIGVIGVGYIGLPLAVRLAQKGFSVVGIDINPNIVKTLKSRRSTVEGIKREWLKEVMGKTLKLLVVKKEGPATNSEATLRKLLGIDVFVVCVPTPLSKLNEWEPDISHIESARDLIQAICEIEKGSARLPRERLVVLESTTYPGTTRTIFAPLLSRFQGNGRKWYLAYSPERTNPGPDAFEDKDLATLALEPPEERVPGAFQITRIIGGKDQVSRDIGKAFYESVYSDVRTVSDLETAELTKLIENTFRFVSIAFANEITRKARTLGINGWEAIKAARTKGFGFELCLPGLIGGHCLPIDPHYFNAAMRSRRLTANFVDVAESEHQAMRQEAFDLVHRLLNQRSQALSGASVLFLGVSYKKNVGDIRESAPIRLMQRLLASGSKVTFWDPVRATHPAKPRIRLVFTSEEYKRLPKQIATQLKWDHEKSRYYLEPEELNGDWRGVRSRVLSKEFNCVVIAANHDEFKLAYQDLILRKGAPAIADFCDAIDSWMGQIKLTASQRNEIMSSVNDRTKYMLIGPH